MDSSLSPKTELEHLGPLTDCSYSPDSQYLVACDANRKVILYKLPDYEVITVCRQIACQYHFTAVSTLYSHNTTAGESSDREMIRYVGHCPLCNVFMHNILRVGIVIIIIIIIITLKTNNSDLDKTCIIKLCANL